VAGLARTGTRIFLLYPALFVVVSWQRGLLIQGRATRPVNTGMAINLAVTGLFLALGVTLRWPGIPSAAVALYAAAVAELLYLGWRVRAELGVSFFAGITARSLRPAPVKE
jgi:hypothetical protein